MILDRTSRYRHCEERSYEAIQGRTSELDCFASLAMTAGIQSQTITF
jgi:hypothetical protein